MKKFRIIKNYLTNLIEVDILFHENQPLTRMNLIVLPVLLNLL